jgi:hypothetical protein
MDFPEPGNLRSKKTREVAKTLKCFAYILKKVKADETFIKSIREKVKDSEGEAIT